VVPQTEIEATSGELLGGSYFNGEANSGEIGDPTFVPATYINYQLSERLFFGLGLNSQYGFATKPDNLDFAGTPIATTSEIFSVTVNPNLAYKVTPEVTVGVGVQVVYADVRLRSSNTTTIPLPPPSGTALEGREVTADDWAFGATAGVTWKPSTATSVGIGFRSAIDVDAEGTCSGAALSTFQGQGLAGVGTGFACDGGISTSLMLPELVTASFRQQVSDRFTLLGTVEWTNWSRVNAQAFFRDSNGDVVDVFPLDYEDGWFVSGGLEYAWNPDLTLRTGLAYEKSPINDENRNVSLPDADRFWLSLGATINLSSRTKVDLGYSHLFVDDGSISLADPLESAAPNGEPALLEGEGTGDIDIVTLGLTHNFGGPEPELEPLK